METLALTILASPLAVPMMAGRNTASDTEARGTVIAGAPVCLPVLTVSTATRAAKTTSGFRAFTTGSTRRGAAHGQKTRSRPLVLLLLIVGLLQACAPHAVQSPTIAVEHANHTRVQRIAFDPGSRRLASGDLHGQILIWSLSDGRLIRSLALHHDSITGLDWLDDSRLISADHSGQLLVSDVNDGRVLGEARLDAINALAVSPERTWLLTSAGAGIRKLSLPGLRSEATRSIDAQVLAIAINHSGDRVAVSDSSGSVRLLDSALEPVVVLRHASRNVYDLAFSPDDEVLAGGGWFRLLSWDLRSRRLYQYRTAHMGKINSVAISPDGAHWLSLGRITDSQFLMTDAVTHQVERYFRPHELCGDQARFSPDGRYAASSSDDGSVYIYDLQAPYQSLVPYADE